MLESVGRVTDLEVSAPIGVAYQISCQSDIYIPIGNNSKVTAFMAGGAESPQHEEPCERAEHWDGWEPRHGRKRRHTQASVTDVDQCWPRHNTATKRIMTSEVAPGDWWEWSWRKKEAATANIAISHLNNLIIESMIECEDKHILALIMLYSQTERRLSQRSLG